VTDPILSQLRPENQLYGFAVWQMLHSYLERGSIDNQIGPSHYDSDSPQAVIVEFSYTDQELPSDFFEYEVRVELDPTTDFSRQTAILTIVTEAERLESSFYVRQTRYQLPLGNLMALLPQLKAHASLILPCLPVAEELDDHYRL